MLEIALAAFFVTAALVAISGRSTSAMEVAAPDIAFHGDGTDLPCPWCRAQTSEHDDHCPSCGQRFG